MKLHTLVLNCSLKSSDETSHTQALIDESLKIFKEHDVTYDIVRLADYNIGYGITDDTGEGDDWPEIHEKVKAADILIIGTPLWLGEKSSIAAHAIERLYGASGHTNEKGQAIYYNKVGGVVITGNEDGAKNAARSVLYALSHIGFTIPPNVDAYWVGEAGPGPSYMDADGKNEFTEKNIKMMSHNLIHMARILKENPIPAEGNTMD
ncbi:flavodoxin family protein [Pseudalkalibacillus berkeleyi]|uniref:Flavodoxin family protein n=1 Tax=Pseudalkalibacillus berkeleyi TaxID=1069813 RepID=A0ABS9H2J2_9BACL|nr:flavodoxin family protein [Pseudalkalibacillus berkeleyi]MCF6139174.1 flavodoxin family protein [Pseudalkalibacillus berkeleyi]